MEHHDALEADGLVVVDHRARVWRPRPSATASRLAFIVPRVVAPVVPAAAVSYTIPVDSTNRRMRPLGGSGLPESGSARDPVATGTCCRAALLQQFHRCGWPCVCLSTRSSRRLTCDWSNHDCRTACDTRVDAYCRRSGMAAQPELGICAEWHARTCRPRSPAPGAEWTHLVGNVTGP